MSSELDLNERSRTVLKEVVCDYILGGEPVGSRSVARKHHEKLSPATIRNVMSDLEELGLLSQTHTSSGRVPTDRGYRYFVNEILSPSNHFADLEGPESYDLRSQSLEEVLGDACSLLSKNSNQAGLVMFPSFSQMLFKHIQFVKVGKNEALASFISEMGVMQNKIVPLESDISSEELTSISRYLNNEFSGKSVKAIRKELIRKVRSEREHYDRLMKKAMDLMATAFSEDEENNELIVDGALNLLDAPEFSSDIEKIKSIIRTIDEKARLIKLLDSCLHQDGITVIIGQEWEDDQIQECSIVAQNYGRGDEKMGTLAVLGPKRMDYQRIINLVSHTADTVSRLLSDRNKREFE